MSDISKDRAEGKVDEVIGRVNAGIGEATGGSYASQGWMRKRGGETRRPLRGVQPCGLSTANHRWPAS